MGQKSGSTSMVGSLLPMLVTAKSGSSCDLTHAEVRFTVTTEMDFLMPTISLSSPNLAVLQAKGCFAGRKTEHWVQTLAELEHAQALVRKWCPQLSGEHRGVAVVLRRPPLWRARVLSRSQCLSQAPALWGRWTPCAHDHAVCYRRGDAQSAVQSICGAAE
eukprot:CAMPEP_0172759172 /NCGR_PEP_ID=MMETSP1074-20121228/167199_1 /TAXON_ID=2916 /ORGANISM="Ceratium fusus, Strain PA161109" /LENGTH=160 /DNA_ID=CAMNT_0013592909 /DNA_START=564 /DNA_END=1047 /DNA_ORIENTATION=-